MAQLEPEVCNFDPAVALDGGVDGLAVYQRLAPRVASVVPDGWIVMEVGYNQAEAVVSILADGIGHASLADLRVYRDVAGERRCVAVRTRSGARA
jgi:release factor glutamine methyltransferase